MTLARPVAPVAVAVEAAMLAVLMPLALLALLRLLLTLRLRLSLRLWLRLRSRRLLRRGGCGRGRFSAISNRRRNWRRRRLGGRQRSDWFCRRARFVRAIGCDR
jgi:hypothetical protein